MQIEHGYRLMKMSPLSEKEVSLDGLGRPKNAPRETRGP